MRAVCGLKPGDVREYIPAAFGNRQDSDPVRVWIKNPTERDKREILARGGKARIAIGPNGPVLGEDGKPRIEVDTADSWIHQHEIVSRFVTKVENYTGAGGVPITNGRDLAANGETEIVSEVAVEIQAPLNLTDDERKNSKRPRASSSEAPAASGGIAQAAESQSSGKAEGATDQR